ncbi:MAG: WYL domain-containing protein [Propionicimonas sp.]
MSPRMSERILNLAICLLLARRFVEKAQIRQVVEGYHDLSDAAFERTFERDKDALRTMGVPVETGSNNVFFPDEVGYRIRREDFELPAVEFTPAETAALGLAASVWESATQADHAVSALAKLRAAGVDPDPERHRGLSPSIGASEPAFASIWAATGSRTPIRFDYRGQARTVEPWTMTYRRGSWYLYGRDRVKDEPRMFKVARVDAPAVPAGKPGSYQVPEIDLEAAWRSLEPKRPDASAVVAIRQGRAAPLRRGSEPIDPPPAVPADYEARRVSYAREGDFVGELCAYGSDVLVLEPKRIRELVIAQLTAVAGGPR